MVRQRGQAISEFLVYMAWLIPFVFMFVAIVQMIKVQTQTHKAARYVAWERTAYSGADYNSRLDDPEGGFDAEIKQRFFLNESAPLNAVETVASRRWQDWKSHQSVIDLENGIKLTNKLDVDPDNGSQPNPLSASDTQINWLSQRTAVDKDAFVAASLEVGFSTENNYALSSVSVNPHVNASYMLIADGWAPQNEAMFSERVEGVRERGYSNAQRWFENSVATRFLSPIFKEIGSKLFVNDQNPAASFNMVSPTQSTSVPTALLEPYEPGP